jgi:hypothetical protein
MEVELQDTLKLAFTQNEVESVVFEQTSCAKFEHFWSAWGDRLTLLAQDLRDAVKDINNALFKKRQMNHLEQKDMALGILMGNNNNNNNHYNSPIQDINNSNKKSKRSNSSLYIDEANEKRLKRGGIGFEDGTSGNNNNNNNNNNNYNESNLPSIVKVVTDTTSNANANANGDPNHNHRGGGGGAKDTTTNDKRNFYELNTKYPIDNYRRLKILLEEFHPVYKYKYIYIYTMYTIF